MRSPASSPRLRRCASYRSTHSPPARCAARARRPSPPCCRAPTPSRWCAPEALAKRRMQLETLLGRDSYLFRQHRSRAMYLALAREIETFKPDVLHCDNLLLGEFARLAPPRVVRAIAPENVDWSCWRGWPIPPTRPRDACSTAGRQRFSRAGSGHICRTSTSVSRSPRRTRAASPSSVRTRCASQTAWLPTRSPRPSLRFAPTSRSSCCSWAAAATSPTASGSLMGPRACSAARRLPGGRPALTVVGSGWEWLEDPRCDAVGHVESLERFYETHHVALVPLRSGGGSRLKVAEALAKGIPVLGTSVGLEELPARARRARPVRRHARAAVRRAALAG